MSNRLANIIAVFLLLSAFTLAIFSMKGDSLTMDELAHLPAGYSYITQKDMRLNPEHPPLVKDMAGFPLLFIKGIRFPGETKYWKDDINGQWNFGNFLLFKSGNPADAMIFWGRMPMLLIFILLGFFIFKWARERWSNNEALLALFFYSFSPTLLAHGRLVTTDVAAALGAVIGIYYFLMALREPTKKNIVFSGIAFGIAESLKFSLILLAPLFIFLALAWWIIRSGKLRDAIKTLVFVFIIGGILLGIVYQFHVWNYPAQKQVDDTRFILTSFKHRWLADATVWMADKPILRPYAQYLLGVFMILQRASGGNTTYFLGEISAAGWKNYFPTVYLLKEPLPFHIFTLLALLYVALLLIKKPFFPLASLGKAKDLLKKHFPEFAMISFIGLYWATSLKSNLNIGVRHLLPAFPFTIMLVSLAAVNLIRKYKYKLTYIIFGALILWQAVSVVSIYPNFLSYFNEIHGGTDRGYLYAVDSNYDWGQDLKRLKNFIEKNEQNKKCSIYLSGSDYLTKKCIPIDKIYVDYFGGADVNYYLGEKFGPWWGSRDPKEMEPGSYLAISATFLQGGRGNPAPGYNEPIGYYNWLNNYQPVARAGKSIFIYYIP